MQSDATVSSSIASPLVLLFGENNFFKEMLESRDKHM